MAKVIPVGPIDPVLYGFAKKQAEKAERDPRYVPKRLETPAHSITYRRVGATVKAFVIDKIAPITFSSPGSVLPIKPNFLHLDSGLPEKIYGRADLSISSSRKYADQGSSLVILGWPYLSDIHYAHRALSFRQALLATWRAEDGEFSSILGTEGSTALPGDFYVIADSGTAIRTHTDAHSRTQGRINGFIYYAPTLATEYEYHDALTVDVSGVFLTADIRDARTDSGYNTTQTHAKQSTASSSYKAKLYGERTIESDVMRFDLDRSTYSFSGACLFATSWNKVSGNFDRHTNVISARHSVGITKNLTHTVYSIEAVRSEHRDGVDTDHLPAHNIYCYVPCSTESEFPGVMMWARLFWSGTKEPELIQYGAEDNIVKAGMLGMFSMLPEYSASLKIGKVSSPPAILTDGICTKYAWFFINKHFEPTDPSTNVFSRLSVVVFPEDNRFNIEDATVHSVKLNHTPSFVARPGDTIELAMYAVNNGSPLVPYVVRGLVKELDEDGNPTDFYLAADGEISGTFERSEEGHGTAKFKLSPHQKLDAYRLISVETTTTRQHGVQAHIEVLGPGVRVPPGPPSITIESLHPTVLAGQEAAFYITATHMANGSRIEYEIRSAGSVVLSSFVNIAHGAGVVRYFAPYIVRQIDYDSPRFVLANPFLGNEQPSSQNFEIRLIHENAPEPVAFSVKYAHESYTTSIGRPESLPLPELFYLSAKVAHASRGDVLITVSERQTLVHRVWYSIKAKRVYVTYWDGKSCEVSNILKKNPESGKYEFNPDWKEAPFDYPPAVDPYEIKGTLEPYVYAYMDYEASLAGG